MLHAVIHPRPPGKLEADYLRYQNVDIPVVRASGEGLRFACSFENVAAHFANFERMFLEPDGSFVWVLEENSVRQQLDGNLVDDGEKLLAVEIKANCDLWVFDRFLRALGWPAQSLLFQIVQLGVFVEEVDFRQHFLRP